MAVRTDKALSAVNAAKVLAHNIQATYGSDKDFPELLENAIEGETNLFEMVEALYELIAQDQEMREGIKRRKADLEARDHRISNRIGVNKSMLLQAVSVLGEKIVRPEFTLSRRPGAISLVIEDESLVPPSYFERPDPKLNKSKLKADLKEIKDGDTPIPGAHLERGNDSLVITKG